MSSAVQRARRCRFYLRGTKEAMELAVLESGLMLGNQPNAQQEAELQQL